MNKFGLGIALLDYGIAADSTGNVFEFRSPRELNDSCVWVTDKDDAYVEVNLAGRGRFKSDAFFGRKLRTIVTDLGLSVLNPKEQAQVLQVILGWALDMSREYAGLIPREAARVAFFAKTDTRQKHLKPILESASQRYCTLVGMNPANLFMLYKPASAVYQEIKDYRFPFGNYRLQSSSGVSPDQIGTDQSNVAFVKITDPEVIGQIKVVSFISVESRVKESALWLSAPEYQQLESWIGYYPEIDEVLTALTFTSLAEQYPLNRIPNTSSEQAKKIKLQEEMSYSVFLVFEALLAAHLGIGAKRMSFSEAYLSALVRVSQIPAVQMLERSGFAVQGYGGGRIALTEHPMKSDTDKRSELLELAYRQGLMTPAIDFGVNFGDRSQTGFGTFFSFACAGDTNNLCQLNHYILED
ncbi:hypothetical protein [Neptuniibacter halophilus]|uniref:hypothetical protein n=1 Tax=Neptuniibacter halophilus TaxID=651666 RepID=UPI002574337A|nr:hypothetical protein [Neptuniibacter halophilus]